MMPTTSAVIIQFNTTQPIKATDEVVGIVLQILILLNGQYRRISYSQHTTWLVVMDTDGLGRQETRITIPTSLAVIIQFTMARPKKATAKVVGIVLRVIVISNCQFSMSIIFITLQMIGGNRDWNFRRMIIRRTRPTTLAVIIQFNTAWPSEETSKAICLVLRVLVLLNFQFSTVIIHGIRRLIGGNGDWKFMRSRNTHKKTDNFSRYYPIYHGAT